MLCFISTVILISSAILFTFTIAVPSISLNSDLLAIEQKLERLKHEEGRLLHQMRTKLLARALEVEVDNDDTIDNGFVSMLSRVRRTPAEEKMRLCGRKIAESVKKLCPNGCTVEEPAGKRALMGIVAKRGLATTCCELKCSMSDIMNRCCPK